MLPGPNPEKVAVENYSSLVSGFLHDCTWFEQAVARVDFRRVVKAVQGPLPEALFTSGCGIK
jgi:hypothetical protein